LKDFTLPYYQGGLTLVQIEILYDEVQDRLSDNYKFLAAIHGVKVDDGGQQTPPVSTQQQTDTQSFPLFQDPKAYEHLSADEKDELTKKMMGKHSLWAGDALKKAPI